jgi:hypothetical protein
MIDLIFDIFFICFLTVVVVSFLTLLTLGYFDTSKE